MFLIWSGLTSNNSTDLQHLSSSEDALDPVLVKVGHTFVHELEQDLKILVVSSLQDDDQLTIECGVGE